MAAFDQGQSPSGKPNPAQTVGMDFSNAIRKVIDGGKISRLDPLWSKEGIYAVLKDGFLVVVRENKDFKFEICEADLKARDWIAIK